MSRIVEQWRPIAEWESLYEISDQGRVKSLARVDARGHARKEKILRPSREKHGHLVVVLCRKGQRLKQGVHVLVCEAFCGSKRPGTEACHLDGDPSNNGPSNLMWGTRAQNMEHRDLHGRTMRGESHCGARLTELNVTAIRMDPRSNGKVAAAYGVSRSAVAHLRRRLTWKHVA